MTQPVCATPQDSLLHCDSTKQQPHSTYDSLPAVVLGCFTLGAIVSSLHPQWCASVLPTLVPAWAHQLISMYMHVAGLQSTSNNKVEATGCCEHFRYTRKGCLCELLLLYQSAQRITKAYSVFITAAAHSECSHMLLDGRKEEGNHLCSRFFQRNPFLESHPLRLLCSHTVSSC